MKVLTVKERTAHLKKLNAEWALQLRDTRLVRTWKFANYIDAFIFVARISVHAEVQKHHPDIQLSYGRVKVTLTTHEARGLTKADFALAERIDAIYPPSSYKRR